MNNQVVAAQPAAFKAMQTDIQVSMDDVVSAFVSQYENNLYDRKKELTKSIKGVESLLEETVKTVHQKVNGDEFKKNKVPFGLTLKVDKGTIDWDRKRVRFEIKIQKKADQSYYSNSISLHRDKPILAAELKAHKSLSKQLSDLRAELNEVLVSLKSVTRKERQVRGRIAMRKLEDSGYASLMQDDELLQLVQLD